MSFHRMLQSRTKAGLRWRKGPAWWPFRYIAAQRVFPDYGDMADAKALLESIGRSWGYRLGKEKGCG